MSALITLIAIVVLLAVAVVIRLRTAGHALNRILTEEAEASKQARQRKSSGGRHRLSA